MRGVIPPLPYVPSLRGASFSRWTTLHLPFDLLVKFYTFSCILTVIFLFFLNISGKGGDQGLPPLPAPMNHQHHPHLSVTVS